MFLTITISCIPAIFSWLANILCHSVTKWKQYSGLLMGCWKIDYSHPVSSYGLYKVVQNWTSDVSKVFREKCLLWKINSCRSWITHLSPFVAQAHSRTCSTALTLSVTGAEVSKDTEHLVESGAGTTEGSLDQRAGPLLMLTALPPGLAPSPEESEWSHHGGVQATVHVLHRQACWNTNDCWLTGGQHTDKHTLLMIQKVGRISHSCIFCSFNHLYPLPAEQPHLLQAATFFIIIIIFFCLHNHWFTILCSFIQQVTLLYYQESSKQAADEMSHMCTEAWLSWAACVCGVSCVVGYVSCLFVCPGIQIMTHKTIHCAGLSINWKTISRHLCFYIWLSLCSTQNVKSNLFYLHLFSLTAAGDASMVTNIRNQVWSPTDVHCVWIRGVSLTHQNVPSCIFYVLDLTSILQLCTNSPSHKSVLMKWWNNDADSAESLSTGRVFPENNTLLTRTHTPVISIHLVPFSVCVTHGASWHGAFLTLTLKQHFG